MFAIRKGIVLVLGMLVLCLVVRPAQAAPASRFFPETGQQVANEFLQYWQATPRPLFVLGYPISTPFIQESFSEPGTWYRVQYFERAVLEEHATPQRTVTVLGRLLGTELVRDRLGEQPFRPVPKVASGWDPVTQHTLKATPAPFRPFYEASGGLAVFGRPLSEQFQERDPQTGAVHWVQYFERQRMEWHPEIPDPAFQILLGRLGDEFRKAHPTQIDQGAFVPRPGSTSVPEAMRYGINTSLFYTDQQRALDLAKGAGVPWVRQQVHWKDHQRADGSFAWGELDKIVFAAEANDVNLLLTVLQAPDWATGLPGLSGLPDQAHFKDYAAFLGALANRYRGVVKAYQIWNEINLAAENGVQPIPGAAYYVDLLELGSRAVKAADPQALIISSALAPTEWRGDPNVAVSDLRYFGSLFAEPRFWQSIDAVGVHVFGCANPPNTLWPQQPGPGPGWTDSREFYFRRVEDVRAMMIASGHGNRQIWITEFGWATANNTLGHEFGNQVSFEQQATYLTEAFAMGRYDYMPWIGAMFVWNLNFAVTWQEAGNPLHQMASYGVLHPDWSPRPAYTALQRMAKP